MNPTAILLRWYKRHGRALPWRGTRNPYKILVSEIMLQQTQVPRVLLFYKKWLHQFPTWEKLAVASNAEVIHAWAGLGYNRRALILRDIAKKVMESGVPKTEEAWRELKGVGPYTAAALAAFSLRERVLPIDTNIRRVSGRLLLGVPFPQPKQDKKISRAAETFLPKRGKFYDVPQALFDLANANCTKRPTCITCPMRDMCPAASKFLTNSVRIPRQMIKKAQEKIHRNKPYPNRIYRGRILKLIRESPRGISMMKIGKNIDPDFDKKHDRLWMEAIVKRLICDHLLIKKKNHIFLHP